MLQTGIASVSVSKHREGAGEGDGGMLPLAAGERELLAHGSVPRGILEESPASPAHQGLEVALRVRWRSFMNELSRALGMKCRHKQSVPFFFSSPALSGVSVCAEEDAQRKVLPYVCAVHKCGVTSVTTVLQECDSAQTRMWDKAEPLLRAGLKGGEKKIIFIFSVNKCI